MKFFKFSVSEDIVLRFIANNFDAGTAVLATDDRLESSFRWHGNTKMPQRPKSTKD